MSSPVPGLSIEVLYGCIDERGRSWKLAAKREGWPANRYVWLREKHLGGTQALRLWFAAELGEEVAADRKLLASLTTYLLCQAGARVVHEIVDVAGVNPKHGVLVGVGVGKPTTCRDGALRLLEPRRPEWAPALHGWKPNTTLSSGLRVELQNLTEAMTNAWGLRGKMMAGWLFASPHYQTAQSHVGVFPAAAITGDHRPLSSSIQTLCGLIGHPLPDQSWTAREVGEAARATAGLPLLVRHGAPFKLARRPVCAVMSPARSEADVVVHCDEGQQDFVRAVTTLAKSARNAFFTYANRADDHTDRFRQAVSRYIADGERPERAICLAGLTCALRERGDDPVAPEGTAVDQRPFLENFYELAEVLLRQQKLDGRACRFYRRHGRKWVGFALEQFSQVAASITRDDPAVLKERFISGFVRSGIDVDRGRVMLRVGGARANPMMLGVPEEHCPAHIRELVAQELARFGVGRPST